MDTTNERKHEARIAWLEAEVARLAAKIDATVTMGDERDAPTPKPSEGAAEHA